MLRKTIYRHRVPAFVAAAFLAVVAEAVLVSVIQWNQAIIDRDLVAHAEQAARERVAGEELVRDNWEIMAAYNAELLRDFGALDLEGERAVARVLGITPRVARGAEQGTSGPAAGLATRSATEESYKSREMALLRLQDMLLSTRDPMDKRRLRAVQELIQLYESWGKPDQAAEWRARIPILPPPEPAEPADS